MEYNWDSILLYKIKNNKYVSKEELNTLFGSSSLACNFLKNIFTTLNDKIYNDFLYLDNYNFLNEIIILSAYAYNKKYSVNNNKLVLSNEDMFNLTHDFYKKLDKDLFNIFYPIFNERFTHFRFLNKDGIYSASTYYLKSIDEVFMEVSNKNSIRTLIDIIHEYAHAISFKKEKTYKSSFISEIESIFIELLAMDYLLGYKETNKDSLNEKKKFYNDFIYLNNILSTKYSIYNIANNISLNNNFSYSNLKKYSKEFLNLTDSDIKNVFSIPASYYMKYVYGYLIAFELYSIYLKDKEYALYLYKNILSLNELYDYKYFEKIKKMGLNPSYNIDTFVRTLKR